MVSWGLLASKTYMNFLSRASIPLLCNVSLVSLICETLIILYIGRVSCGLEIIFSNSLNVLMGSQGPEKKGLSKNI